MPLNRDYRLNTSGVDISKVDLGCAGDDTDLSLDEDLQSYIEEDLWEFNAVNNINNGKKNEENHEEYREHLARQFYSKSKREQQCARDAIVTEVWLSTLTDEERRYHFVARKNILDRYGKVVDYTYVLRNVKEGTEKEL